MGCRKLDIYPKEEAPLKVVYSAGKWPGKMGVSYSYFGARYYDPNISIWLSVDPMSDKYSSISPYAYTANNPIRLKDPNGMELTEYENSKTGETININDNINERVEVSDEDWGGVKQLKKDWDAGVKDPGAKTAEIKGYKFGSDHKNKYGINEYGDSDGEGGLWPKSEKKGDPIDLSDPKINAIKELLRDIVEFFSPAESNEHQQIIQPQQPNPDYSWKQHERDWIYPSNAPPMKWYDPKGPDSLRPNDTMRWDPSNPYDFNVDTLKK